MMHDDTPLHLRRAPIYQPPDAPQHVRMSPWAVFGLWALAALFAGAGLAWGLIT